MTIDSPTPSKGKNSVELRSFYLACNAALMDWEARIRELLERNEIHDTTILFKYGEAEIPVPVATYSELLSRLPQIFSLLTRTVLITAVANFEAFLEVCHDQLISNCPTLLDLQVVKGSPDHEKLMQRERREYWKLKTRLKRLEALARIEYSDAPGSVCRRTTLEIIATRNLQLHNQGLVDELYAKEFPENGIKIGDLRPITPIYVNDSLWCLEAMTYYIDYKCKFRIAEILGTPLPTLDVHGWTRKPKKGKPRKTLSCWCICPRGDARGPQGIVGRVPEWSRRGILPGGDEIALCVLEIEPERQFQSEREVTILPPLDTIMARVEESVKLRLSRQQVLWDEGETLRDVLKRCNVLFQENE